MSESGNKKRHKSDDGFKTISSVNYSLISDKVIEGARFEREKSSKKTDSILPLSNVSSTFDAFRRLTTGQESRTVADKLSDASRPTWEQYKKDNEDKLDMIGVDQRKMNQYRKELDLNRERLMTGNSKSRTNAISDSDDSSSTSSTSSDDSNSKRKHKSSKKKRKHKSKKHRKEKVRDSTHVGTM